MPGPLPSETRRRRNKDVFEGFQTAVSAPETLRGPALTGDEWSDAQRAYWEMWRRSPQAENFVETDWMRVRLILPLLQDYLTKPTAMKLGEIRANESLLGATHGDRVRQRIKITPAVEGQAAAGPSHAAVTALDAYRAALSG